MQIDCPACKKPFQIPAASKFCKDPKNFGSEVPESLPPKTEPFFIPAELKTPLDLHNEAHRKSIAAKTTATKKKIDSPSKHFKASCANCGKDILCEQSNRGKPVICPHCKESSWLPHEHGAIVIINRLEEIVLNYFLTNKDMGKDKIEYISKNIKIAVAHSCGVEYKAVFKYSYLATNYVGTLVINAELNQYDKLDYTIFNVEYKGSKDLWAFIQTVTLCAFGYLWYQIYFNVDIEFSKHDTIYTNNDAALLCFIVLVTIYVLVAWLSNLNYLVPYWSIVGKLKNR